MSTNQVSAPNHWLTTISSFLHALFLALDANFRLKRKNVSSQTLDPGLNRGYAYFVEEVAYKDYLERYTTEVEPVRVMFNTQL